jgi:HD-GYP domain-containing protein (c-di-GMP phosphodiesterase class II)
MDNWASAGLSSDSRLFLEPDVNYETKTERVGRVMAEGLTLPHLDDSEPERIVRIFESAVRAMGQMMEVRDPYTAGHQARVSRISVKVAQVMALSAERVKGIQLAAMIHDIGKLAIPSEILSKPGKLSAAEFDMIKQHSSVGYSVLKDIEFPWPIAQAVLQHHERMNGTGYPNGLKGQDILLEARILCVADVIEAMSSARPYRPAIGMDLAIAEINKNRDVLYDSQVVEACLEIFKINGFNL